MRNGTDRLFHKHAFFRKGKIDSSGALFTGNSITFPANHSARPYIHHRFAEGTNANVGVDNFELSQWKKWYHIVCSNEGLGGFARTYVNGTFASGAQRFERRITNELSLNSSAKLCIGVNPDSQSNNYFLGMIDEVRLYSKAFGSEDVQHLYRGDPGLADYKQPREETKKGMLGSLRKITPPTPPSLVIPTLTYGTEVENLDLGGDEGIGYLLSGLPPGLSSNLDFLPSSIPGLFAWYASDRNDSFTFHPNPPIDRNDSVALDDLLVLLSFDENNGTFAYDHSGMGNHGSLIDQASWKDGFSGTSLSFDGENDGLAFSKIEFMDRPTPSQLLFGSSEIPIILESPMKPIIK